MGEHRFLTAFAFSCSIILSSVGGCAFLLHERSDTEQRVKATAFKALPVFARLWHTVVELQQLLYAHKGGMKEVDLRIAVCAGHASRCRPKHHEQYHAVEHCRHRMLEQMSYDYGAFGHWHAEAGGDGMPSPMCQTIMTHSSLQPPNPPSKTHHPPTPPSPHLKPPTPSTPHTSPPYPLSPIPNPIRLAPYPTKKKKHHQTIGNQQLWRGRDRRRRDSLRDKLPQLAQGKPERSRGHPPTPRSGGNSRAVRQLSRAGVPRPG